MEQMMRARMSLAIWAVVAVAIPLSGVLSAFGLVEGIGWQKLLGLFVFFLFIGSIAMAVGFGTVWLNESTLEARCLLGRYRIEWDEIERLWRDNSGLNWVVEGHGKRVAIPGPSLWKSPHKEAMIRIMKRNFVERDIKPQISEYKTFLLSNRAAKIKKGE